MTPDNKPVPMWAYCHGRGRAWCEEIEPGFSPPPVRKYLAAGERYGDPPVPVTLWLHATYKNTVWRVPPMGLSPQPMTVGIIGEYREGTPPEVEELL